MTLPNEASAGIARHGAGAMRLALKVVLVGLVCQVSTEIGFAHKFPPHFISPLWPTGAILFGVLVAAPVRHWWAYILAAYFTSILNDARAGFPVSAILFVAAGLIEIFIAAVGVRRFAGGVRAFESLRSIVAYILIAVVVAPFVSAFVAASAGTIQSYWFYWRVWFLSEALAYLMLAPAILTWTASARTIFENVSLARFIEVCLIVFAVFTISVPVFSWPAAGGSSIIALVYLPLPFLLLAAVRFGPAGVNTSLLIVAFVSISSAVEGRGPFAAGTAGDSVLPLQLFLATISVPLILLAALVEERRQKTDALRESEQRRSLAAKAANLVLWTWSIARNDFWLTPEARQLFGWDASAAITLQRFIERLHPADQEVMRQAINRSLEHGDDYSVEFRVPGQGGAYRWMSGRGQVEVDSHGKPLVIRGVAMDITELKRAEEKFRLAVEASPSAVVMVNQQGQIVLINSQGEKLFGYTRDELIGQPVELLVPERVRGVHPAHRAGFFAAPQTLAIGAGRDLFARRKDGTEFLVEIGLNPIQTNEETLVLTAIVDITERKRADAELQRNREELAHATRITTLGELAASLAHELSQPLTAVLSNAQAARRFLSANPAAVEEVGEILQDIIQDGNRAADIIRWMRTLAKKEQRFFEPLDPARVTSDVVSMLRSDAILRQVQVSLECDGGSSKVRGDKAQLQQVVLNLLLNAFDAMRDCPPDDREVLIQAREDGAGMLEVAVCDRGTGLSSEKLDKIFQPFFTTKRDGLGIGLSISRSIVEAHGGRLWAENNTDRGATFYFTVPVVKRDEGGLSRVEA